jgi:hypothetical protein
VEAGIGAEVHDELGLARLWFTTKRAAGVRLEVPASQAERTEDLLRDWDTASDALRHALRCPECRSLRVDYPQFTPKSFLTNLALGFVAELRLVEREYYCEECHCMWPPENTKPRRMRAHMAPNYFVEGLGPPLSPALLQPLGRPKKGRSHPGE